MRPASEKTTEKYLATEVAEMLTEKLREINAHDYESIERHKKAILDKLSSEYEVEDMRLGGSHARSTDVAGLSDIDVLVSLGDFKEGLSSEETIAGFAKALQDRFPKTEITPGKMAVTVRFSDEVEVQVLPAFRHQDGYRISDPEGKGWITTYPNRFARQLTQANQRLSGNVIPTIKLAKAICKAQHVDVKSYHLENLALRAFEHYTGPKTLPSMLRHLFEQAKSLCLKPTRDLTGQSDYVDDRLSITSRQTLARGFRRIEQDLASAMSSTSLEPWEELFK